MKFTPRLLIMQKRPSTSVPLLWTVTLSGLIVAVYDYDIVEYNNTGAQFDTTTLKKQGIHVLQISWAFLSSPKLLSLVIYICIFCKFRLQ